MKWRRDTCLLRPSSFAHLKLARLPVLAQGLRRVLYACRQFWSNICPRKNKSPLSLTTGRASLVSNRALLNRRRITDPRETRPARPFRRLTVPSFRSRSTSPVSSYPARPIFFFHWQQNHRSQTWPRRRLALPPGFLSKILSDFYHRYFAPFFPSCSIVNDDLGQTRLKSRVPTKNAGRRRGAIVSSEHESRHTETLRTYLASCYRHSSGEKRERLQIAAAKKSCTARSDRF